MAFGPQQVDYYNSIDNNEISKSRQFIQQFLRGDIVGEQAKYTVEQYETLYSFSASHVTYNAKPTVTVEAEVKVRYDDILKCAYHVDSLVRDSDKLISVNAQNQKDNSALNNLLESNAACKQAWDKFLMLARLADGDVQLIEKLQNRKLL
jgi:hypothetical protein